VNLTGTQAVLELAIDCASSGASPTSPRCSSRRPGGSDRRGRARLRAGLPQPLRGVEVRGRAPGPARDGADPRHRAEAVDRGGRHEDGRDRSVRGARMPWPSCWSPVLSRSPCLSQATASRRSTPCPSTTWWTPPRRSTRTLRAVGRTFHLVDPNPSSARRVYETIAQRRREEAPPPVARVQADGCAAQAARPGAVDARAARRHSPTSTISASIPAGTRWRSSTGPASAARRSRATSTT